MYWLISSKEDKKMEGEKKYHLSYLDQQSKACAPSSLDGCKVFLAFLLILRGFANNVKSNMIQSSFLPWKNESFGGLSGSRVRVPRDCRPAFPSSGRPVLNRWGCWSCAGARSERPAPPPVRCWPLPLPRWPTWSARTIGLSWWTKFSTGSKCWSFTPGSWHSKTRFWPSGRKSWRCWRNLPTWPPWGPSPGSAPLSWWVKPDFSWPTRSDALLCRRCLRIFRKSLFQHSLLQPLFFKSTTAALCFIHST